MDEKIKDFGHIIPVKIIGSFEYGNGIEEIDFNGYYSKAMSKIEKHHKIYDKIIKFLNRKGILQ